MKVTLFTLNDKPSTVSVNETQHCNLLIFAFNGQHYKTKQPTKKKDVEINTSGMWMGLSWRDQPLLEGMSMLS